VVLKFNSGLFLPINAASLTLHKLVTTITIMTERLKLLKTK